MVISVAIAGTPRFAVIGQSGGDAVGAAGRLAGVPSAISKVALQCPELSPDRGYRVEGDRGPLLEG